MRLGDQARIKQTLDGLAVRNANRGDSCELIRANRFAERKTVLTTFERFARIASNLPFAFLVPRNSMFRKGGSVRKPSGDSIQANQASKKQTLDEVK